MTKKIKASDHLEIIHQHFARGGGALTSTDLVARFDINIHQAAQLLTKLLHSPLYRCQHYRQQHIRVLTGVERVGLSPDERVRQCLLGDPSLTNTSVAQRCNAGGRRVRDVRAELEQAGLLPPYSQTVRKRTTAPIHDEPVIPTKRHPEDEPHLARAARFRQIWPAGRQHAGR